MESTDLVHWSEPQLLRVMGPEVPREKMGRLIDAYLLEDINEKGKWWCFYKQIYDGKSWCGMSFSYDLENWTYVRSVDAGENGCVITMDNEYILFHSPQNGIGVKRSYDLETWREDGEPLTFGQAGWEWAAGRLTAGFVADLKNEPCVGKYLMFFHGSKKDSEPEIHGEASLGIAWSDDLKTWEFV